MGIGSQPVQLAQVFCGVGTHTNGLVTMRRAKFDDKAQRELDMLSAVSHLSDVPPPQRFHCCLLLAAHSQRMV